MVEANFKQLERVLLATLNQADAVGYRGYSKFDGLLSPVTQTLSFGWWPLRLIWTQLIMRSPVNLRPWLRVKQDINPEAPALFAQANLNCLEMGLPGPFEQRARWCLDWLLAQSEANRRHYRGCYWGYHHPWQSPGFYQPPHDPNCYITAIIAGALLDGYRVLKEDKYLQAARDTTEFILHELPVLHEDEETKAIAYVPAMRMQLGVININALAGAILACVGEITGEACLPEQACKLMAFVARQQTDYGGWYYTTNPNHSLVVHDNYHTGMILDAFLSYEQATKNQEFSQHFTRGLDYYRRYLFLANGAPKWANNRVWPHDVHGSAQGILTFALAGDLQMAQRIAAWALTHFYKGDGAFAYQQGRYLKKPFTLLHWCNGWMARGLGALLGAQFQLQ